MNRFIYSIIFVILLGVVVRYSRQSPSFSVQPQGTPSVPAQQAFGEKKIPDQGASGKIILIPKGSVDHLKAQRSWKEFLGKFGPSLKPEFARNGRLISIRGELGVGNPDPSDFQPTHPQKSIQRAREVIDAARELLGLRSDWPLENATARNSEVSAQVYFSETHQGLMLAPVGNVKVDLGPHGELLALYSDYASSVVVTNEVRLDSDQAQSKVASAVPDSSHSQLHIDGGSKIVWVKGTEGRIAYQYSAGGRQVVIDAMTGEVLLSKDRRYY